MRQQPPSDRQSLAPAGRSNREKVAIVLAALSKETAVNLLQKLDAESLKSLLESAARLGDLNASDFDPVAAEFTDAFGEALGISAGTEHIKPLFDAAFPEDKVSEILGVAPAQKAPDVWSRLTLRMEAALCRLLQGEHEQAAAVILSRLPPDLAARLLGLLPPDLSSGLLSRILRLRKPDAGAMQVVEQALEEELFGTAVADDGGKQVESVASLVNRMDSALAKAALEGIAQRHPELSAKLRRLIFMFEDIPLLEQKSRTKLFDRVGTELIAPSLAGTDATFKECVLSSLGPRARRMVESELGQEGAAPAAAVDASRKKIADLALQMAIKGEITLPDAGSSS